MIHKYAKRTVYAAVWSLMAVFFLFLPPFTSNDISFYFRAGEVVAQGGNPYADGLMYGPLAPTVFSLVYRAAGGSLEVFTLLWKVSMLVVLVGVLLCTRLHAPKKERRLVDLLMLAQPLLLWEWVGAGHFDGLWVIPLLLAFWAAKKSYWWLCVLLLSVGASFKIVIALFAPWFVLWWWQSISKDGWKKQILETCFGLAAGALLSTWLWKPFWIGWSVFDSVILQTKWAVHSLFASLYYLLRPLSDMVFGVYAHPFLSIPLQFSLLGFLVWMLWPLLHLAIDIILKKRMVAPSVFLLGMFVSMLGYMLIWQKSLWPWYFCWLIPIGVLIYAEKPHTVLRRILVWIGSAPLLFYVPQTLLGGESHFLPFFLFSFFLMSLYPIIQLFKWRQESYSIADV